MAGKVLDRQLQALRPNRSLQVLSLLSLLDDQPAISQHRIAEELGTYSNTVNRLMKSLVEDGLVRMRGETNRTMSYHVTETGKALKQELLVRFSTEIVQLYGMIKREIERTLAAQLQERDETRLGLFGAAETGEVVIQALRSRHISPLAVYDSDPLKQGRHFWGLRIRSPLDIAQDALSALIVASYAKGDEMARQARELTDDRVVIVRL